MKHFYSKHAWYGIITVLVCLCLASCEFSTIPIPDLEGGENSTKILDSVYSRGCIGYAFDKSYSEFIYDVNSKNLRLKGVRKGVIVNENGKESVKWESNAAITYGGGSANLTYEHNGIKTEVVTNEYHFAETVRNTHPNGKLHSQLSYGYNQYGYLNSIRLEREGKDPVLFDITYPDSKNNADAIVITEYPGPVYHSIPLAISYANFQAEKMPNNGLVCNVLRYSNSALINDYVLNPDLYYLGLYGMPYKYLPNELIENGVIYLSGDETGGKRTVLARVGNYHYFYNN